MISFLSKGLHFTESACLFVRTMCRGLRRFILYIRLYMHMNVKFTHQRSMFSFFRNLPSFLLFHGYLLNSPGYSVVKYPCNVLRMIEFSTRNYLQSCSRSFSLQCSLRTYFDLGIFHFVVGSVNRLYEQTKLKPRPTSLLYLLRDYCSGRKTLELQSKVG